MQLWTALGVPWLPQTLLVGVRHRHADPDDARRDLDFGARVAALTASRRRSG